jgi:hypothetical protein
MGDVVEREKIEVLFFPCPYYTAWLAGNKSAPLIGSSRGYKRIQWLFIAYGTCWLYPSPV